jgi:glycosyltransferase involved in cell wall biosynthesis
VAEVTAVITCMTEGERPFLREAVESVRRQTQATDILVCVADTNTWVDEVLPRDRTGITLLQMPLAPAGEVRNAAVSMTETEMVAFLDGDDAWEPDKAARQVALLRKHDLDVIASKHVLMREDGKPFFYAFASEIPMTSSWLARTDVLREHRFTSRRVGQDVELWHKLEPAVRCGVAEAFLLRYRVRPGSASKDQPSMRRKLAYERRSHSPGGRAVLLAGSRLANVALDVRRAVRPTPNPRVVRVR